MTEQSTTDILKEATGMSIGWAVIMTVLGFTAVFLPFATGLAVSIVVGWFIVFSGAAYLAYAFSAQGAGSFLWRVLIGIAYVLGGIFLTFHPGLTLESLTIVVAAILLAESALEVAVYFHFRSMPGAGWILFDAIVTLVLAYVIWRPWPSSSGWAIGTLVGVNLIVSGTTRLMYSVTGRKTLKAIA
jgi:uncharacterized membrane protein HdeD (DUF308 family)